MEKGKPGETTTDLSVLVSNLFHTRLPCVERRLDDFLLILSLQEYENIVEVVASIEDGTP